MNISKQAWFFHKQGHLLPFGEWCHDTLPEETRHMKALREEMDQRIGNEVYKTYPYWIRIVIPDANLQVYLYDQ